ncbi:MAG: hypothetical protein GF398_12670 [Chitinivibrionales bacterium]|nr:hypothetical protein [Chitinivibrionales bacterium]
MKISHYTIASLIAFVLSLIIFFGMYRRKANFDKLVRESQIATQGYDTRLVGMVNKLEKELAIRASFGFPGGKDPMTGRSRTVARPQRPRRAPRQPRKTEQAPKIRERPDPIKLTAVIFDDTDRKHTAIIMDGERSLSVEVGDVVDDRRITHITNEYIAMESSSYRYRYDIYGNKKRIRK